MTLLDDGDQLAKSLADRLGALEFTDLDADEVTALLVEGISAWGTAAGWRVYRRARSVLTLPPPYSDRHSVVDVACARQHGAPIVVEVDLSDRRRTVEKLLAESDAGRIALWVRWGRPPFAEPPAPVRLVACPVDAHRDPASGRRLYSSPGDDRPPPAHSDAELDPGEQPDLFG